MKWIKASERLPEMENRYYVKMENGFMSVSYFNGKRFEHPEYVSDRFEWLDESPTEIGQQGEWQLCPKCYGDGHLARYNSPTFSTTTHPVCDVCMGAKILSKPNFKPQEGQDELWGVVKEIIMNHYEQYNYPSQAINELKSKFTIIKK